MGWGGGRGRRFLSPTRWSHKLLFLKETVMGMVRVRTRSASSCTDWMETDRDYTHGSLFLPDLFLAKQTKIKHYTRGFIIGIVSPHPHLRSPTWSLARSLLMSASYFLFFHRSSSSSFLPTSSSMSSSSIASSLSPSFPIPPPFLT